MTYASTMFATCPTCFAAHGRVYDKDSAASKEAAEQHLAQAVEDCNHVGTVDL